MVSIRTAMILPLGGACPGANTKGRTVTAHISTPVFEYCSQEGFVPASKWILPSTHPTHQRNFSLARSKPSIIITFHSSGPTLPTKEISLLQGQNHPPSSISTPLHPSYEPNKGVSCKVMAIHHHQFPLLCTHPTHQTTFSLANTKPSTIKGRHSSASAVPWYWKSIHVRFSDSPTPPTKETSLWQIRTPQPPEFASVLPPPSHGIGEPSMYASSHSVFPAFLSPSHLRYCCVLSSGVCRTFGL